MSGWWDWDGPLCDYAPPLDALTHAEPPEPPDTPDIDHEEDDDQ